MLHTRCILCAFYVHFCCIAGAFVAFFRISYYTSALKLFGGNCNGIRSRLPVLSNSALKTRRQTSSQYGSKNSIREREMKNVFGIRETPKSIRLHLNGILFRSKNAVLVHFGTHTTQHNTTQHENPLLKVPRRRGTEDAGRLPAEEGNCVILWYKMPVIPQWVSQKKSTFAAQQGRMSILLPIFAPSRFFIVSLQPKKK